MFLSIECIHRDVGEARKYGVESSGYRIVVVYMHGVYVAAVRFCLARLERSELRARVMHLRAFCAESNSGVIFF